MIDTILHELVGAVHGARAVVFLDGDGETIAQAGAAAVDMKLLGAWQEIHFDRIKDITLRLGLGNVHAVLFSQEEGNALIMPVEEDYALLLFVSSFSDVRDALATLRKSAERLQEEIR